MGYLLELICRMNVIFRNVLGHKKEERFLPAVACAFWLMIVGQSILFLLFIKLSTDNLYEFTETVSKTTIISIFVGIVIFFYWPTKLTFYYNLAEKWFESKEKKQRDKIIVSSGIFMMVSFFGFLIWMLSEI